MGGFLAVSTTIHGGAANPGIPFIDSPTGGIYETPDGGFGVSLSGNSFFEMDTKGMYFGYKPPQAFALSAITGSPFASGTQPYGMAMTPDNAHLIVANFSDSTITVYNHNTVTGVLTPVTGSPFATGAAPHSVVVSPDGLHVYVTNLNGNSISAFSRNAITGFLNAIGGSPFSTGAGSGPGQLIVSADGAYVLCVAQNTYKVIVFSRNAATGFLTPVAGSPFASEYFATGIAMTPDQQYVFVSSGVNSEFSVYSFNSVTGALAVIGVPIVTPSTPNFMAVTPNGKYLIASNSSIFYISVYAINSLTGALTEVPGSPFATGVDPSQVIVSSDSLRAYLACSGDDTIRTYLIDPTTGTLTASALIGNVGGAGAGHIVLSIDGLHLYASNININSISGFKSAATPRYNLLTALFDSAGNLSGSLDVFGLLRVAGQPILNEGTADLRYAAIAGLLTQAFAAKTLTLDHAAGGLIGTTTNDNAIAGAVGEYIQASVASGAAVPLTTNVAATVTSIALTAGDWDVEGVIAYHSSGTTNVNDITEGIGTVAATLPVAPGSVNCDYLTIVLPAAPDTAYIAPRTRISLAAPATIYLVCLAHFTVSTLAAYGQINARRVR